MANMAALLKMAQEKGASDLHITVDNSPVLRIDGELTVVDSPALDKEATRNLVYSMLND